MLGRPRRVPKARRQPTSVSGGPEIQSSRFGLIRQLSRPRLRVHFTSPIVGQAVNVQADGRGISSLR
jgi:hypothetical protein